MKNIGILTYHTGYNYGASLQAYALQTTVKKLNGNCKIINFETERFVASREMFSRKPNRIKEIIKIVSRLPYWDSLHKRQQLFDDFTNKCLDVTDLLRTEQGVVERAEDFDCIVCGSDQIWNLSQLDAPAANPLFFLNFEKKQRRVSYAASFGKWVKEAPKYENIFMPWLKQFDFISVREISGVEYLQSRGIDSEICLDPTVLLDAVDYDKICVDRLVEKPYILLFGWNCNQDLVDSAKNISKKLGLPVVNIVPPPRAMFCGIERKLDIGPREFLSMIKYADFIVTNSFHGTAFSTTYKKPYVSIVSGKEDPRMASLLEQLGIKNHLVEKNNINLDEVFKTDYENVEKLKINLRKSSVDYLRRALEL